MLATDGGRPPPGGKRPAVGAKRYGLVHVIPDTEAPAVPLARKPKVVEPFAASEPFQLTFFAVTVDPDVFCDAPHICDMDSPLVNVHFTVHPLSVEVPLLVTVTPAWNPPPQDEETW